MVQPGVAWLLSFIVKEVLSMMVRCLSIGGHVHELALAAIAECFLFFIFYFIIIFFILDCGLSRFPALMTNV